MTTQIRSWRGRTPKRKGSARSVQSAAPQSVWIFDLEKLRPGDVVLERTPRWMSRFIRVVDWSEYSHALIFLGPTDFLEAVGAHGARVISFARIPITNPSDWIILRHPDEQTARGAAIKARSLAHKKYGKLAAFRSKWPFRSKDDATRLFCSQLVAEAYARAGALLIKGKTPSRITPRLLHKMSALKPLEQIPIRRTIPRNTPPLDRDAGYAGSATAREMLALQKAFDAVKPELNHLYQRVDVSPRPGNMTELFDLLMQAEHKGFGERVTGVVEALERALDDVKYFDLYSRFAEEAELAFSLDKAFARSEQATGDDCTGLARQFREYAAGFAALKLRCDASALWFESASGSSLWLRLAKLNRETAQAAEELIGVAQAAADEIVPR